MAQWLNNEPVAGETALFDLSDRGLLLGDGVFSTALVLEGQVVYRDAHLKRLLHACNVLGIDISRATLSDAMSLAANGVRLGSVRVTVTRGSGPRGIVPSGELRPAVIASNSEIGVGAMFCQLSLLPSSIRRNDTSPTAQLKTLGYLDAILATRQAREAGFDEPLMLNTHSRVACTGTGNIFVLRGNRLSTPPPSEGLLPGIMRAALLRVAPGLGIQVVQDQLTLEDLIGTDAVLVTNCLKLLATVTAIGPTSLPPVPPVAVSLAGAICDEIASDIETDPRQLGATISFGAS